jgi:general secretion pathway protein J
MSRALCWRFVRTAPCRDAAAGFTLIELLVALFITAIVFTIGYGAINQALNNREALQTRQARLNAVETAVRVLVQDFSQVTPRPVRDIVGTSVLPCLVGSSPDSSLSGSSSSGGLSGSGGGLGSSFSTPSTSGASSTSGSSSASNPSGVTDLVTFTRAGWANPAGIQRPALERVAYRLQDGVLKRMHWPVLDVTEATAPIGRDLLDHVKSVGFRYMTDARQWTDQWPPAGNANVYRLRPFAIEVTLELEDWGKIVRIIEVPA